MIHCPTRELIFDLDDVLAKMSHAICAHMNRIGSMATVEDYTRYAFFEYHGLDHATFNKIIDDTRVFAELELYDGVKETIRSLQARGFNIHIVTAREGFKDAFELTDKYLKSHGIYVQSLTVMGKTHPHKSHYYNQLARKPVFIVDDAVHNIVDAVERGNGIQPILVTRPWNVNDVQVNDLIKQGLVIRIDSVNQIPDLLQSEPQDEAA